MMKIFTFLTALFILAAPWGAGAADARFFETLYDIPVMPGMAELPDRALTFDKPEGRFAQAGAAGAGVSAAAIKAFYAASLPQLGWTPSGVDSGADAYVREGEKLTLSVGSEGGYQVARFTLSPAR